MAFISIKTNELIDNIVTTFKHDVDVSNSYYMFFSSLNSDTEKMNNSDYASKVFLEKTIFAKKVSSLDVKNMIYKMFWTSNTVYDYYDNTETLTNKKYYVVSKPENESGDYHVFKCLYNNLSSASSDKPTYNNTLPLQNYILRTSDGYIWKYLYSITDQEYRNYSTNYLVPVLKNNDVSSAAVMGIDVILVENNLENSGYEKNIGDITSVSNTNDNSGYRTINISSSDFNQIRGYYTGYSFYATAYNGTTSKLYEIADSGVINNQKFVSVKSYTNGDISTITYNWTYVILPRVEIIGDGTGAIGISNVTSNGSIDKITMLETGNNYTRAIARIVEPLFGFNTNPNSITCKLKPIISPSKKYASGGGHGYDPALELRSNKILFTTTLKTEDNLIIPDSNTYSRVGLIKSPEFYNANLNIDVFDNRIAVQVNSVSGLTINDEIFQPSTNFRAVVHDINSISNNHIIYLTDFFGPHTEQTSTFYMSNLQQLNNNEALITADNTRIEILTPTIENPSYIGVVYPNYKQGTGEALYLSEFDQIERTSELKEQFKIIIEF